MKQKRLIAAILIFFMFSSMEAYAQGSLLDSAKEFVKGTKILDNNKGLVNQTTNLLNKFLDESGNVKSDVLDDFSGITKVMNDKDMKNLKSRISKELPQIISRLKSDLDKTPNDTKLLLRLAIAYQLGGKYSLAIVIAQQILAKDSDNINAAFIIAQSYKLEGETQKAIDYIEKFVKTEKNNGDLTKLLSTLKKEFSQNQKEIKKIEDSIHKSPSLHKLYSNLAQVYTKTKQKGIKLFVDGKKADFSKYNNIEPVIKNGTTFIPIRAVADCMNAKTSYNANDSTVKIEFGNKVITLKENDDTAQVNNRQVKMDKPVQNINGTLMVPLRFLSQQLSKKVNWYSYSKYGIISIN